MRAATASAEPPPSGPQMRTAPSRTDRSAGLEFGEHGIDVDGRRLAAWCAWDTLFLPELLRRSALVNSRCPVTGEPISLTVTADGPRDVSPGRGGADDPLITRP